MTINEEYVDKHPNQVYWYPAFLSWSEILNKLKENRLFGKLCRNCKISSNEIQEIFGIRIHVPRRVKFDCVHSLYLGGVYRFLADDIILDSIPRNQNVYNLKPVTQIYVTKGSCAKRCNELNDAESCFKMEYDNTLVKHLRILELYYNMMIVLTKKYKPYMCERIE